MPLWYYTVGPDAHRKAERAVTEGRGDSAYGLTLHVVPEPLRRGAAEHFEAGDVVGFLLSVSNERALELVFSNIVALKARGIYEAALLQAWTGTRTNHHCWSLKDQRFLFELADGSLCTNHVGMFRLQSELQGD